MCFGSTIGQARSSQLKASHISISDSNPNSSQKGHIKSSSDTLLQPTENHFASPTLKTNAHHLPSASSPSVTPSLPDLDRSLTFITERTEWDISAKLDHCIVSLPPVARRLRRCWLHVSSKAIIGSASA